MTKDKILARALELFNQNGIEYVGMRELAADLGMRIGNITYYFPTKDDMVFQLTKQYSELNSATLGAHPVTTLGDFLKRQAAIFENQLRYRSLMLSMVHIISQNAQVAENYAEVEKRRKTDLRLVLKSLGEKGFLVLRSDDLWFLLSSCSLIMRFWLSEVALGGKTAEPEKLAPQYLKLLAMLFKPYSTKKGVAEIDGFIAGIEK